MNLNTAGWASRVLTPLLRVVRGATNATVPVIAISEPVNSETAALVNADIALVAKGTGATLAQVPDGTVAGGNKRGNQATDWQKFRTSASQVASGTTSTISGGAANIASQLSCTIAGGEGNTASSNFASVGGGISNTASGQSSFVGGGSGNTASGTGAAVAGGYNNNSSGTQSTIGGGLSNQATSNYSFVGGGQSNVAQTNTYAAVCGGSSNTASGQYSFVGGGFAITASGQYSLVAGGFSQTASGVNACIVGGESNTANASHSFIAGGRRGFTRSIVGYHVFPACNIPLFNAQGATQAALLLLARQTTDATPTVLTSNTSAAGTTNQVILPNNGAYSFSGEIIANVTGGGNTARWTIDGAIKRGANAASTAMVGTPTVTMTHNDAGAAAWVVAVTADTTNGGIAVTVTGAAATTIRWVCRINTTEMSD